MAIGSGLGGSVGFSPETTYGTYVAPTKFLEVDSADIKKTKMTVQGGGLAAGRVGQLASRRVFTAEGGTGSIPMEVTNKGFGSILDQLFGTLVGPTQQAATTAYKQTHTLAADMSTKSGTWQAGVPDTGGTVRVFTGKGGKITKGEFSCGVTEILKCGVDLDFQKVSEAESLAAPSYVSYSPFHGGQMQVKLGTYASEASVSGVKKVTLSIERPQNTELRYASGTTPNLKASPILNDYIKVTGSLDVDFMNKTDFHDRFSSDTSTSLVWLFVGPVIASTYYETLKFTLPATFFDDTMATLSGPDVVSGSVPFTAQLDLTNGFITCEYTSTDTTL